MSRFKLFTWKTRFGPGEKVLATLIGCLFLMLLGIIGWGLILVIVAAFPYCLIVPFALPVAYVLGRLLLEA